MKYGEAGTTPDQQFFRERTVSAWQEHFTLPMLEEAERDRSAWIGVAETIAVPVQDKLHRTFCAYPRKLFAGSAKTAHQSK